MRNPRRGAFGAAKRVDAPDRQRIESAEPEPRLDSRHVAGRDPAHGIGDGLNVRRGRAAATADDVQPAVLRPFLQLGRERFWRFRKTGRQQRVGQPGIRIGADENGGDGGELLHERSKLLRAQRAIHADAQERHVRNGIPKRLDGLARDTPVAASLNVSDRGQNRNLRFAGCDRRLGGAGTVRERFEPAFLEGFQNGKERRLPVQRVEDGFDEQEVGSAVQQPANLFAVSGDQGVESGPACTRIVDVGADGRGLGGRPDRARNETHATRLRGHHVIRRAARADGAGAGQFVGQRFHAVIPQGNGLGVERVRFDDIRPSLQVLAVDLLDQARLGDVEQVVITLEVLAPPVLESLAAKIGLTQPALLDHGPHRTVEDDDPFVQQPLKVPCSVRCRAHV